MQTNIKMAMNLYEIFYSKLPERLEELLPNESAKYITFLNPYYIEKYPDTEKLYEQFDYICSDGMVPIFMNKLFGQGRSWRCSFDMGSLAAKVFQWLAENKRTVYFLGTTNEKLKSFTQIIQKSFPALKISGTHHGYIKGMEEIVVKDILQRGPDVVVVGMGAPLQDEFSMRLKDAGFHGTVYTCGGFMHQTSEKLNYYPEWINRWNLRTFYRLARERYVWGRVLKYYPKFVLKYSFFLLAAKCMKKSGKCGKGLV